MKKTVMFKVTALMLSIVSAASISLKAQSITKKPKLTVLNIASQGMNITPAQAGNMVRRELAKIQNFEVMDKYDVMYLVDKHGLKIDNCYGKICLLDVAKVIKSDKMFTGSIERYQGSITITFRMIDVASQSVEKVEVMEYLFFPENLKVMVSMTIRKMMGLEINKELLASLSEKDKLADAINTPMADRLKLNGPRMGFTMFTGTTADLLRKPEHEGGFDASPVMFQFGYQIETQYLNSGNFQALFEFIPTITGLDQGLFIPSLTILNGIRSNKSGWEFAFGPTVSLTKQADGYYQNDEWVRITPEMDRSTINEPITTRLDSRGDFAISPGFVFAVGKTFRSGKLNIPVNAFVIPGRDGVRFGVSFGYNSRKSKY
ncbi:MAG TPA: hypothetical protein DCS93_40210 [Microscillaceae bacterium]|nr:hypothetical protein [Microscillaceae bacterium]